MISRAVAVGLGLVLALSGCSDARSTDAATKPELSATLIQQRTDEGTRRVAIQVTNTGSTPFHVSRAQLEWRGTATLPPSDKDSDFYPGRIVDLAIEYGGQVRQQLDADGQARLERFYTRECALRQLAEVAEIRLSDSYQETTVRGVPYLSGTLVLTRPDGSAGSAELTVESLPATNPRMARNGVPNGQNWSAQRSSDPAKRDLQCDQALWISSTGSSAKRRQSPDAASTRTQRAPLHGPTGS